MKPKKSARVWSWADVKPSAPEKKSMPPVVVESPPAPPPRPLASRRDPIDFTVLPWGLKDF